MSVLLLMTYLQLGYGVTSKAEAEAEAEAEALREIHPAGLTLCFKRRSRASVTTSSGKRSAYLVTRYSPVNSGSPASTRKINPFVSTLPRVHSIRLRWTPLFVIFCRVRDAAVL